ncbi:uncharacterized protein LOC144658016 [Oculina patagonica]
MFASRVLSSCNLSTLPVGVFSNLSSLRTLDLSSNNIQNPTGDEFVPIKQLRLLEFSSNDFKNITTGFFSHLKSLTVLYLDSNDIQNLTAGVFSNLANLTRLSLRSNNIQNLHKDVFFNLSRLYDLDLSSNNIQNFTGDVFSPLKSLTFLNLSSNKIQYLSADQFSMLKGLEKLYLDSNNIHTLAADLFSYFTTLEELHMESNNITNINKNAFSSFSTLFLWLSSNNIEKLPAGLFSNASQLILLDLSHNKIKYLPESVFWGLNSTVAIYLQNNMITAFSSDVFANNAFFRKIFLSANRLENIPRQGFHFQYDDKVECFLWPCGRTIMLSDNPIKSIEPEAFNVATLLTRIYLLRTKLKVLSLEFFSGFGGGVLDSQMLITNRTITTLRYSYNGQERCTVYVNPQNSQEEAIAIESGLLGTGLVTALLTSGFREIAGNISISFFLPCPLGTFTNSSSNGKQVCTACPPGGFYSDDVGHVAPSCKKCPNGSFVHFDKAPGTQSQDCKSCPRGTETDFFAGYRACECLEGFYRTHLFAQCYKCVGGLQCTDDYASLRPGYWWKWRSKTHRRRYTVFINNLKASLPALGADDVRYPYTIPTPYQCPREESCIGGLDSPCEVGYEGPLCAVCSSGYYRQLKTCEQCPTKKWIVGQLSIVAATLLIIITVLVWTSKRNTKKDDTRSVIDMLLSKVKIVIGFYQVTYGLLETFSYIKWPGSLEVIGKYSAVLQMNVLQIAPIHCLYHGVQVDALGNLFVMMAMNAAVIGISGVACGITKVAIFRNGGLDAGEMSRKLLQIKESVSRNMFFFLYTTYLSTCSMTANVLPLTCRKLCLDDKEKLCSKYLKADYSIQCHSSEYNHSVIVAYISAAYVIAIPVASFIALWRQRIVILAPENAGTSQDAGSSMETITGLRFLFENYRPGSWYWELVEMSRKVVLTSGLILVGEESRSYIGLTLVIAGMYGMVFSWVEPIKYGFENKMMSISLAVTVFNLAIGAVSRIPAENISSSSEPNMETFLFNLLVLGANTLVIGLLAVQYLVGIYRYLKEWRKRPHWSFACWLALLLPLNNLQGEISGLEMSTIVVATEDSGAVDVHLEGNKSKDKHGEQGKQSNGGTMESRECTLQGKELKKKFDQETQTQLLTLSSLKIN